jgi:hypothetical protein
VDGLQDDRGEHDDHHDHDDEPYDAHAQLLSSVASHPMSRARRC